MSDTYYEVWMIVKGMNTKNDAQYDMGYTVLEEVLIKSTPDLDVASSEWENVTVDDYLLRLYRKNDPHNYVAIDIRLEEVRDTEDGTECLDVHEEETLIYHKVAEGYDRMFYDEPTNTRVVIYARPSLLEDTLNRLVENGTIADYEFL